mmetsp:Transcript_21436/g.9909  ORF Transcript_21436/g.9909 Transcript_21436/m.9909 type:complete len:140 (-) Transcript_21436:3784-4203(-)
MGICVLICGAISKMPANIIASAGIKLIPFVTGNAAQVLDLYINNEQIQTTCSFPSAYFMPGCKRQRHRNKFDFQKEVNNMPTKDDINSQEQGRGMGKKQGTCNNQGQGFGRGKRSKRGGSKRGAGQGRGSGQGFGNRQA